MKEIIRYAHCVKATPGQLDREPFYQYEAREASVEISLFQPDDDQGEWIVRYHEKIIANEARMESALGSACYSLMGQSRIRAEKVKTLRAIYD